MKENFKEARKMLDTKSKEVNLQSVDYGKLIRESEESKAKIDEKMQEAYNQGNIIVGDELSKEKRIIEDRIDSLKRVNVSEMKKRIGEKYKNDTLAFYRSIVSELKEEEAKDCEEARTLLLKYHEIASRSEARKKEAMLLFNNWSNSVAPFQNGEMTLLATRISRLEETIKKNQDYTNIIEGNTSNMVLPFGSI